MASGSNEWWTNWNTNPTNDPYGTIYGGSSVQEAIYNTLQTWLPSYIAEINRQLGGDILQNVTEYRHRPEFRTLPKNVQCAILVMVPGTARTPHYYQEFIRSDWRIEVDAFVYGTKDWQETQALTSAYSSCIRACLIQHKDLDGFAETTKWMSEDYYEGEHSATRTTGLGKIRFEVTVGSSLTPYGGAPVAGYAPTGVTTLPTTMPLTPPPISTGANIHVSNIKDH